MTRAIWKNPYYKTKTLNNKTYITRNSEILPKFVGLTFNVHNGLKYKELTITEDMVGHRFGEFFFTRAKYIFKKSKKKSK